MKIKLNILGLIVLSTPQFPLKKAIPRPDLELKQNPTTKCNFPMGLLRIFYGTLKGLGFRL